ncbi:MAG TPA: hypothetical protein OIM45_03600 [Clostridiaceae bacterium]|nr:hypothetical protein [Clostridiaceae bacterium]
MKLTNPEKVFLKYYLDCFNAKWMKVYNNKHVILDTRVDLYTIYKRKLKTQPKIGQETYTNMFRNLEEGKWYKIQELIEQEKEE